QIAGEIAAELIAYEPRGLGVRDATEALALDSLQTQSFSLPQKRKSIINLGLFWPKARMPTRPLFRL
ncbi:MAG: hypothetical protein KC478_17685, partial [Bacteriovoracaceae bacterium]|nr:hypothetical protein [Bacteriovoracaceae bacterium]